MATLDTGSTLALFIFLLAPLLVEAVAAVALKRPVNRTVGQARRLPIHGMASGSACPTNLLNSLTEIKDQIA